MRPVPVPSPAPAVARGNGPCRGTARLCARLAAGALLLILAGCARVSIVPAPATPEAPPRGARYEPAPGRDMADLARLRLAPPPTLPELAEGSTPLADRNRLAGEGYTRIGTGRIDADSPEQARQTALILGQRAGAERVLLYPPDASDRDWQAACYVRLQLLFGATFRDLRAEERAHFDAGGVSIGKVLPGTPASRANLMQGDIVLAVDGKPVDGRKGFEALLRQRAGQAVTLTMVRHDVTLARQVRLGALPPES